MSLSIMSGYAAARSSTDVTRTMTNNVEQGPANLTRKGTTQSGASMQIRKWSTSSCTSASTLEMMLVKVLVHVSV
jgi:hypothetical protein